MNKLYVAGIAFLLSFTGCIEDPALEPDENVDETSEPYLQVSGMDEDHYNGSYVVSNQTFGGRPILVHENENEDTTYIFYNSERGEWIIQPVEPSDEWNAHMVGKGDIWDPAEANWDNDKYTMVLEWIGGNPTSEWRDDESNNTQEVTEEETQDYNMTVVEILDGDTFDLGNEERVRIIGINTPEKGRPFSDEATDALSEMIMGKEVTLVNDSKNDDVDSSGRLLRHVYVEPYGISVNYEMIRTGMAFWYPYSSGTDMDESYQEAQESAAYDHVGLWTESQYNITIDYIEYDPEGSEVDGEYLIITNHDNYNINMEGWYLQDEAARTAYEFNYTLEINTSVRIYTGSGEDNQTTLFWGWYQGIWNNGGDMAILQDENGLMVDYYRYGYN